MTRRFKLLLGFVLTFALLALPHVPALSQGQMLPAQQTRQAWTLEEAFAALSLQPRDAYLQYVVLQLARRAGRLEEFAASVQRLIPNDADVRAERREGIDLFSSASSPARSPCRRACNSTPCAAPRTRARKFPSRPQPP